MKVTHVDPLGLSTAALFTAVNATTLQPTFSKLLAGFGGELAWAALVPGSSSPGLLAVGQAVQAPVWSLAGQLQ
ncbi:MAG: hypothetical protein DI536_02230 [Archangium gephyra]|uniref:Uncharacterized protein n=1 Tax=Archangium gephyra TaxID=48 RepID=A0A2W5TX38_9BACT|nr:MAG: hypothetical protein DI536_02230 [Archangium gephyra]